MNVSARSETEVEVGRGDHFSHDVSERLVMKDEETAAIPMAPSGGSSGIEQPLQTPRRRTFLLLFPEDERALTLQHPGPIQ
jgi:hypothetical protein